MAAFALVSDHMSMRMTRCLALTTSAIVAGALTTMSATAAHGVQPTASPDAQRFDTWAGFDADQQPIAVVAADFNGDGRPDVAWARHLSAQNTMLVRRGDGHGGMGRATAYPTTTSSNDLAAGDLDGDGDLDIVVVSEGAGLTNTVVDVFVNDGSGRFARTTATGGHGAQRVEVADLNGDGTLDLAITNYWQRKTVSILLGKGNGTFRPESLVTVGPYTSGVVAADLDGDGDLDLAVGWLDYLEIDSYVAILVNRGRGRFVVRKNVLLPADIGGPVVAAADFTGDGRPDLAAAGGGETHILLRNRGKLAFTSTTYSAGFTSTNLTAADVDGDDRPDLISATIGTSSTGNISYLRNLGRGRLAASVSIDSGAQPWDAAVADFDGDHRLDLAVVNNGTNTLAIQRQRPNGTFANPPVYAAVPGEIPLDTASADFDGDGFPDMALSQIDITSGGNDVVAIMHNDGTGAMDLTQSLPTGTDSHAKSMYASDLNGDDAPDLLWTPEQFSQGAYQLAVSLNNGNGVFGPPRSYILTSGGTGHVTTADIDGDGDQDAIVANNRGPSGVRVLLNRGNGTFKPDYAVPMGDFQEMAIGVDLDGDGILDIAAVEPQLDGSSRALMVVFGKGGGTFGQPTTYTVGNGPRELAAGDFNGDGAIDLVTANKGGDNISNYSVESTSVLLNSGDGTFASITKLPTEEAYGYYNQFAIAVGDIDGDGSLDIVDAHPHGQNVGVYYGKGDGTFGTEVRFGLHAGVTDVNLSDYDQDGTLDIGSPDTVNDGTLFPTGGVSVLLNKR